MSIPLGQTPGMCKNWSNVWTSRQFSLANVLPPLLVLVNCLALQSIRPIFKNINCHFLINTGGDMINCQMLSHLGLIMYQMPRVCLEGWVGGGGMLMAGIDSHITSYFNLKFWHFTHLQQAKG